MKKFSAFILFVFSACSSDSPDCGITNFSSIESFRKDEELQSFLSCKAEIHNAEMDKQSEGTSTETMASEAGTARGASFRKPKSVEIR